MGVLGSLSIYTLLNLMSATYIDAYRVVSVLGYCLLPMVGVGALSVMVTLEYVLYIHRTAQSLTCPPQRHARLRPLHPLRPLVHMVRLHHLRRSTPYVRTKTARRVSCWITLWLLCAPQCLQCWLRREVDSFAHIYMILLNRLSSYADCSASLCDAVLG